MNTLSLPKRSVIILPERRQSMEKAFRYRIYPNKKQKQILTETFGCVRFVYNYYLDKRIKVYEANKETFGYTKCSQDLTQLKKQEGYEWLKAVDSTALQSSLKDLEAAFKNYFERVESGFPKFKSRKRRSDSYTTKYTNGNIKVLDKHVKLPKLGNVRTKVSRPMEGRILSATISRTPAGRYYVSICCTEVEMPVLPGTGKHIGIDVGIENFCVFSDDYRHIENPRYLKSRLKRLASLQRSLSRKTKGSSRYEKARLRVAKKHDEIHNMRTDFLQKLSTDIVREYDIICIEDLNVKKMLKNKDMACAISDASWSEFIWMLKYKSAWYGKTVVEINRYYPSSQTCSNCGFVNKAVKDLSVRKWTCPVCGTVHDRDENASTNILNEGLKMIS